MLRKLEILESARILFNESNTQAITTNHIAKAMGISVGNLHYHYSNREEIIRLLYQKMREEMTLSVEALPKIFEELQEHQKSLIAIQWKYRFFFREMLFLFARDSILKATYIKDTIAHRSRIRLSILLFIENKELAIEEEETIDYVVDAILMSWQFYSSLMETLGRPLSQKSAEEALEYTSNAMKPYKITKEK